MKSRKLQAAQVCESKKGSSTPATTLADPEPPASIDPLDSPKVVAEGLGIATQTLANWRSSGRAALPYLKIGRLVRYRRSVWTRVIAEAEASE